MFTLHKVQVLGVARSVLFKIDFFRLPSAVPSVQHLSFMIHISTSGARYLMVNIGISGKKFAKSKSRNRMANKR